MLSSSQPRTHHETMRVTESFATMPSPPRPMLLLGQSECLIIREAVHVRGTKPPLTLTLDAGLKLGGWLGAPPYPAKSSAEALHVRSSHLMLWGFVLWPSSHLDQLAAASRIHVHVPSLPCALFLAESGSASSARPKQCGRMDDWQTTECDHGPCSLHVTSCLFILAVAATCCQHAADGSRFPA